MFDDLLEELDFESMLESEALQLVVGAATGGAGVAILELVKKANQLNKTLGDVTKAVNQFCSEQDGEKAQQLLSSIKQNVSPENKQLLDKIVEKEGTHLKDNKFINTSWM